MRRIPLLLLLLVVLCATVVSVSCTSDSIGSGTAVPTSVPSWFPSTSFPTSASASVADRGTYWPWATPRGVLPDSVKFPPFMNQVNPPQEAYAYHVIWQLPTNTPVNNAQPTMPYQGRLVDATVTTNHTYYRVTFPIMASAQLWYNTVNMNNTQANVVLIGQGRVYQSLSRFPSVFPRLMLRYSYLLNENVIASSALSSYDSYLYYVTARSSMGEFRMITYNSYPDAVNAFQTITQEYTNNNNQTQQRAWDTVKLYSRGSAYRYDSVSRGSELEHQGAFQWLSLPPASSRSSYSYLYYLLVSFTSLSGVTLERVHFYGTYDEAAATQQWIWWYTSMYEPSSSRASSVMYHQQRVYSSLLQYGFSTSLLQQHFNWITTTTTTSYPTPYYPYYPSYSPIYTTPTPDRITTSWSDLSRSQITFIIAYPTCWLVAVFVVLLIVYCCLKRRYAPQSPSTRIPPHVDRLSCFLIFLSLASFILLIISLSLKRFSNADHNYGYFHASYGPFHVDQSMDYSTWLYLNKTAQVMNPITGVCMLLSMMASLIVIGQIKYDILSYRVLFLAFMSFIFSFVAIMIWLPVHIRLQDYTLDYTVTQGYPGYRLIRWTGAGFILVILSTGIHAAMLILCICIHKKYRQTTQPQPQQEQVEGLQLVSPTSPYYYRDVPTTNPPAVMAVPVPAYMYGVPHPTAPPTAPPPFMFAAVPASGYPYAAPMYHPPAPAPAPVAEPLYQPISAPAPYTASSVPAPAVAVAAPVSAPVPVPAPATYPSLPVDVPGSGPNTDYQRLL